MGEKKITGTHEQQPNDESEQKIHTVLTVMAHFLIRHFLCHGRLTLKIKSEKAGTGTLADNL